VFFPTEVMPLSAAMLTWKTCSPL